MEQQMRGPSARLLGFCGFLLTLFSDVSAGAQGDVLTAESTTVSLGVTVTLKCVLLAPSDILQITWQKKTGSGQENVATYTPREGVNVKQGYSDRLNVTLLQLNETAITFKRVGLEDEGCYLCIFNTFPGGSKQGSTCVVIRGDVATEEKTVAEIGTQVTLKCVLRKSLDVLQITWQKNTSAEIRNLATFAPKTGVNVDKRYKDHLNITLLSLNETAITFWKTNTHDEGCYQCLFNAFPSGSIGGTTCLSLYGPLWMSNHHVRSSDALNATCSATSWPAPVLRWIGEEQVLKNGSSKVHNSNGTVSVSSWVLLNVSQSLANATIACRAQNGLKEALRSIMLNEGHMLHATKVVLHVAVALAMIGI
ncbi:OX-2 membrane glycoprotein-like isoform X2 [Lissotriton helveticus]